MKSWHSDSVGSGLIGGDAQALWRVHSVFARACNLVDSHGTMLALIHHKIPRTPFAIRLAEQAPAFTSLFETGMEAHLTPQALCIDGRFTIQRQNESVWDASLKALGALGALGPLAGPLPHNFPLCLERMHEALELAQAKARLQESPQNRPQDTMAQAMQKALNEAEHAMAEALQNQHEPDAAMPDILDAAIPRMTHIPDAPLIHAAQKLLGLGHGLTPSGDDMLVGILAGLRFLGKTEHLHPLQDWLKHEAPRQTNAIAATFIEHACAGRFSEGILDIFVAMEQASHGDKGHTKLDAAIVRLLQFGASSGYDTLRGIRLALHSARHPSL